MDKLLLYGSNALKQSDPMKIGGRIWTGGTLDASIAHVKKPVKLEKDVL